jgi:endonuclease III
VKRPATLTGAPIPVLGWPPDPDRVEAIFARLAATMPEPKTELDYRDAFTLVVAVALSAQATDVSVNKATARLFAVADTPAKMLALGEEGLIPLIASIGLYRGKARNVIALSRIVLEQHGGEVPLERSALQALPGVGRKTASVVLNELGVEPAVAVDTHVFRVSHRLGLANAATPDKVEDQLLRVIPQEHLTKAHHWLILHGRYTCTARKPNCPACAVADLCPSRAALEGVGEAQPRAASRRSRTARAKARPPSGA